MMARAGGTLVFGAVLVAAGLVLPHRVSKGTHQREAIANTLEAEVTGCGLVRKGPVCEVGGERRLKLFAATSDPVQVTTDRGTPVVQSSQIVPGGRRVEVQVPEQAREIVLSTEKVRFGLALAPHVESPALGKARDLRQKGDAADAEKTLRDALPNLPPEDQGRARALIGRILLARGEVDAGLTLLAQSTEEADAAGRVSDAIEDRLVQVYAHTIYTRRFAEARASLAQAGELSLLSPADRPRIPYYTGLLALETGDLRGGLAHYYDAAARAERLDLQPNGRHARQQIALTLAMLGRIDEAIRAQTELLALGAKDSPCNRLDLANNLVWISALAKASKRTTPNVDATLQQLTQSSNKTCSDPTRLVVGWLTATEWAIASNDTTSARKLLHRLDESSKSDSQHALLRLLLEGRVALMDSRGEEALAIFSRVDTLARAQAAFAIGWSARTFKGVALHKVGKSRDAIEAWFAAERELDTLVLRVPLGEGRTSFAVDRDESARRLVSALVDAGRVPEALQVARRARSRTLRSLVDSTRLASLPADRQRLWDSAVGAYLRARAEIEQTAKDDWRLPADALAATQTSRAEGERRVRRALDEALALFGDERRPNAEPETPPEGKLVLTYFPGVHGWLGFAQRGADTTVKRLPAEPASTSQQVGRDFLDPFRTEIAASQRVRAVTYGALRKVDFHALPFEGRPLIERVAVEYGVDAGGPPRVIAAGKSVIVSDPTLDLPQSRAEGNILAGLLPDAVHLSGRTATRKEILAEVSTARWFHFAGHARFAGTEGTDAALRFADGDMTVSDILALPRGPSVVFLNACDAGRSGTDTAPDGVGLADAFVLRGASAVIASVRPVRDEMPPIPRELYARLRDGEDPADALRHVLMASRGHSPNFDWSAFRTIVP